MIELARVVAIHPGDHSIDAIIMRTGQRCVAVPVLAQGASSISGISNLPAIPTDATDARWNAGPDAAVKAIAALMPTASGNWICLGFKFPEVNAVLSAELGRQVVRHPSGAWHMIAPDGTVTIGHPSGAVAVMGPNLTPTNPVGGDVDGLWAHGGPAASAQVGLHMAFPSGASITLATDGKATLTFPAEVQFNVPLAKFSGSIEAVGDVKAGTVSLRNHRHRDVEPGGGLSGAPQA